MRNRSLDESQLRRFATRQSFVTSVHVKKIIHVLRNTPNRSKIKFPSVQNGCAPSAKRVQKLTCRRTEAMVFGPSSWIVEERRK